MSFFSAQNPGIGGLDELTDSEEDFLVSLVNQSYSEGDILFHDGSGFVRLPIGSSGEVLKVDTGVPVWGGGGGGISWSAVTANTTMAVGTGSLANKATLLTLTLPATSAVGETVRVAGMNAGLWKVAQAANQYIKFGNQNTTTGTGGSLASVSTYDAVELVCIEANVGWVVVSSQGNITVT